GAGTGTFSKSETSPRLATMDERGRRAVRPLRDRQLLHLWARTGTRLSLCPEQAKLLMGLPDLLPPSAGSRLLPGDRGPDSKAAPSVTALVGHLRYKQILPAVSGPHAGDLHHTVLERPSHHHRLVLQLRRQFLQPLMAAEFQRVTLPGGSDLPLPPFPFMPFH